MISAFDLFKIASGVLFAHGGRCARRRLHRSLRADGTLSRVQHLSVVLLARGWTGRGTAVIVRDRRLAGERPAPSTLRARAAAAAAISEHWIEIDGRRIASIRARPCVHTATATLVTEHADFTASDAGALCCSSSAGVRSAAFHRARKRRRAPWSSRWPCRCRSPRPTSCWKSPSARA